MTYRLQEEDDEASEENRAYWRAWPGPIQRPGTWRAPLCLDLVGIQNGAALPLGADRSTDGQDALAHR